MRRLERRFQAIMEQAFGDMRDRLFNGLDDASVLTAVARLNQESVITPFRDKVIRMLQTVAIAGADFGRQQVERQVFGTKAVEMKQGDPTNIDWQLANNAAAEWARKYGFDLVNGITDTTRQRLQREITHFIQNKETMPELIERLEDVFGPGRAEMIAVTETTRAFQQGSVASWKESGVIKKKEVRTANDELVCPICGPKNDKQYDLDDPDGDPPFHVRCRCFSVGVTEFLED